MRSYSPYSFCKNNKKLFSEKKKEAYLLKYRKTVHILV